jgi:hypothetical protein
VLPVRQVPGLAGTQSAIALGGWEPHWPAAAMADSSRDSKPGVAEALGYLEEVCTMQSSTIHDSPFE